MTYREALEWLNSTQQFGIKLGLENTRALLAAAGNPERECRFLHVAGTNGKGSVCAMLDAILREEGFRTGLYTSPHLVDFRERIRVNGGKISEESAAKILTDLRTATAGWDHAPTFFELATVLALRHFADEGCEFVVLETGMGGRLDSTNAITPVVSIITPIAIDHAQWLGDTLEKIAAEKAGIFKSGVPAVSAWQSPEVISVLHDQACATGATLNVSAEPIPASLRVNLDGSHQRDNAALALRALQAAEIFVSPAGIQRGLARVSWPGRFQRLRNFILDGAHNPHAAGRLVRTWREIFDAGKVRVIFGALEDKDYREILETLDGIAAEFRFVPVRSARSANPGELATAVDTPSTIHSSLAEAIHASGEELTLVTGSLFLVGEALEILDVPS